MYRQHFGIKAAPLGKEQSELWDDGALARLNERFQWLLQSPGLGLLTGEAGVGKTAALRHLTQGLNPHIGSEEAKASVCPQNRAYGSVHGSSCKAYPLRNIKPMR